MSVFIQTAKDLENLTCPGGYRFEKIDFSVDGTTAKITQAIKVDNNTYIVLGLAYIPIVGESPAQIVLTKTSTEMFSIVKGYNCYDMNIQLVAKGTI